MVAGAVERLYFALEPVLGSKGFPGAPGSPLLIVFGIREPLVKRLED